MPPSTNNFMNIKQIIVIIILFCTGCSATKLTYQPQEYNDISKCIEIIKNSLNYQSSLHAVKSIEIKPDFLKIVSKPNYEHSYIHFEYIGNIDFHEKNEWKIVTIKGENRRILYRLYVKDKEIAKSFINAIYTLKNNPKALEIELNKACQHN